jgi:hypothetical protein
MMSEADLTSGSGVGYAFVMYIDFAPEWRLYKYSAGIANNTPLQSGDQTLTPAVGTNYTMQLEWSYHTLIGGTRLLCKVGLAENEFEDLVTVYDYTDSSTPLTTSVGEGILYADLETVGTLDLKRIYFDDTSIVQLAATPLAI